MPFPFIPFGAMTAGVVLGGTFALFFWLANRLDRAVTEVGGAVVGRLVSGLDDWSHDRRGRQLTSASVSPGAVYESADAAPVEPLRRRDD